MLSRVADSIYWMSRYIERAENVARFIDVNHHLMLDLSTDSADGGWQALITASGDREAFFRKHSQADQKTVIDFLTFDIENPNSIVSCVTAARENARSVREVISTEMWEEINRFYHAIRLRAARNEATAKPHEFFTKIKSTCQLFVGMTEGTMTHGEGWHFLRLGRLLERADKTSRILDVKYFILLPDVDYVGSALDTIQWGALLKSASAFEMYCKRHHQITPDHVVDYLLLDREFPRSVHYCVIKAEESVHSISGSPGGTYQNPAERKLGKLRAELDYGDFNEIITSGLHEYIDDLQTRLNEIGSAIFETFFALHRSPQMQMQSQEG